MTSLLIAFEGDLQMRVVGIRAYPSRHVNAEVIADPLEALYSDFILVRKQH